MTTRGSEFDLQSCTTWVLISAISESAWLANICCQSCSIFTWWQLVALSLIYNLVQRGCFRHAWLINNTRLWVVELARSLAIVEEPRDAVCWMKPCQSLHEYEQSHFKRFAVGNWRWNKSPKVIENGDIWDAISVGAKHVHLNTLCFQCPSHYVVNFLASENSALPSSKILLIAVATGRRVT